MAQLTSADWEPLVDVNQAADKGAGTVVSHAVNGDDPAGVGWTTDTGAGALGRHGSEALNSSEN